MIVLFLGSVNMSLRLDPRGLDDRPPLVGLRLVVRAKGFGRLLIRGWDLLAQVEQLLADSRIRQRLARRGVQLRDDVARRPLRPPQRVPDRRVEARQSR